MWPRNIRTCTLMLGLIFGVLVNIGDAAAGKVPIPCTGERILKVMTLPDKPAFTTRRGQHIDLGYLYQGCSSGKWVGYISGSSQYVTLKDGTLPAILAEAGITTPPSEPSLLAGLFGAPMQFWGEWIWIVVIVCIGIAAFFSKGSTQGSSQTQPVDPPPPAPREPAAEPAVRRAVSPRGQVSVPRQRAPAALARKPRILAGAGPSPSGSGFGRRG